MQKIKELAFQEFVALAEFDYTAKDLKRKALREFKQSIKSHIALREFESNGKHFKSVRPLVSTIDDTPVRKETLILSTKAERRVNAKVSKYQKSFERAIDGAALDIGDEIIAQRADYHLRQYKELVELTTPTRSELIRVFLTWIKENEGCSNDQAVAILRSFEIPTLKNHDIFYTWKPLQPTAITFRTFEL